MYNSSMNRRAFIESTVATGILTSLPMQTFAATHQISKVGVQLYTVRGALKQDFAGTLARVAGIGYKEVEFAGYFNHSPADVRAILDKNGLSAPSCHVSYDIVQNRWPEAIDAAHTIGQTYIICPSIDAKNRKSAEGWKRVTDLFNKAGEASKRAGIQFGYHNHWLEFVPDPNLSGKLPYDYLLDSTDPNLVKMEMDLGWAAVAGQDPLTYFQRNPGRFPLVHIKDFKTLPHLTAQQLATFDSKQLEENEMTEPGHGQIDWKRIFAKSDQAGIQHFFVEHDAPKDAFASLTASYQYLSALRF